MNKNELIEFLQNSKGTDVFIAIPFKCGHTEYCDSFLIEETGENEICITTGEIKARLTNDK
jgi:hypothetical protein